MIARILKKRGRKKEFIEVLFFYTFNPPSSAWRIRSGQVSAAFLLVAGWQFSFGSSAPEEVGGLGLASQLGSQDGGWVGSFAAKVKASAGGNRNSVHPTESPLSPPPLPQGASREFSFGNSLPISVGKMGDG